MCAHANSTLMSGTRADAEPRVASGRTAQDIIPFSDVRVDDADIVGGKGANLGELTAAGFPVPDGFVVTKRAFAHMRDSGTLATTLTTIFDGLDVADTDDLTRRCRAAQQAITSLEIPRHVRDQLIVAYGDLSDGGVHAVIARSSATMEDASGTSFAGMNETFGNLRTSEQLLEAVRNCWASLFAPRSVTYRANHSWYIVDADIAVVVQRYVPATRSGVMFSTDPVTGSTDRIVIEASFGGGEAVVSGSVTPDRYTVDKADVRIVDRDVHHKLSRSVDLPTGGTELQRSTSNETSLTDAEIEAIARMGIRVEQHYGTPQDMEWLFDADAHLWLVQSRPITTVANFAPPAAVPSDDAPPLVAGLPASHGWAQGSVRILETLADAARFRNGDVLVTNMTAPDWVPLMRRASAIVTNTGGMTCHAAIVARELELPCIVGTGRATDVLEDGQMVTVDATRGVVRGGAIARAARPAAATPNARASTTPMITATRLLVNLSEPGQAERTASCDVDGVGLLRAEIMLVDALDGEHPLALIADGRESDAVERLTAALTTFAEAFGERPITYRTIDFRSNEFRGLTGGADYEQVEANPMLGLRGAGRYATQPELIRIEIEAVRRVWQAGHQNVHVMLPFVRTPNDVRMCTEHIRPSGLLDDPAFQLWIMAEVPSVLVHLPTYARMGIAGISIGTNDLTQLMLGVDRDSELLAAYEATDAAVMDTVEQLVRTAQQLGLRTSICGEAPASHESYVDMLVRAGIGSISVAPQSVRAVRTSIARAEHALLVEHARRAIRTLPV